MSTVGSQDILNQVLAVSAVSTVSQVISRIVLSYLPARAPRWMPAQPAARQATRVSTKRRLSPSTCPSPRSQSKVWEAMVAVRDETATCARALSPWPHLFGYQVTVHLGDHLPQHL